MSTHRRMIVRVEFASFTFEFYEHVKQERCKSFLDPLAGLGCSVERLDLRMLRILCSDPYAQAFAGWMLFQTALSRYCRVIAATGEAGMDASAYKSPPSKYKTRKI